MYRYLSLLLLIVLVLGQEDPNPRRFMQKTLIGDQVSIGLFQLWDKKNSRIENPIVFVGSSSIRKWYTAEYFPNVPIVNRGFGGSHISDVIFFIYETVLKFDPRVIVFYAGDNDIHFGKSAQKVFEDYINFVEKVHSQLPNTKIIFIPIKPSPSRWSLWAEMKKTNHMVQTYSQNNALLYYIDTASAMLNEKGKPESSFFVKDSLHLSQEGYDLWSSIVKPILYDIYKGK